jgi:hypothetical protein
MGMAGDDVIVTTAGQQTPGGGRVFSSREGKNVPGLAWLK